MRSALRFPMLAAAGLVASSGAAIAQDQAVAAPIPPQIAQQLDVQQDVGVLDRLRPAYDAKGIPIGGFRLFPQLEVSSAYDDNVYLLPSAASDEVFSEIGSARLVSEWGRHFVELYSGVNNYNYATFSALNLTDWDVGSDGRYDVARGVSVSAAGSYGEYHEPLYSPNTLGTQAAPNRFYKGHAESTAVYQPNRLGFGAGFSYDRYDFSNAPLVGGGVVDNADRDEDEYQAYARSTYDFSPGYSAFVKASYDSRSFDQILDRDGFHRASTGYRGDAGVDLQITNLLRGEVYLGYLEQHFDQHQVTPLKNIDGLDFGAQLDWYATQLMTVHLTASHQISDVTLANVSASDDEIVKLSADYELGYNIVAGGYGGYTHSKLEGITRADDYPTAGVSLKYLVDNHFSADLSYSYRDRSSNVTGVNFTDNIIRFGITGHI
jgi:hypothetical protein